MNDRLLRGIGASDAFLLLAIIFMPLQVAFTIQLSFPIKISEILILLAGATRIFSRHYFRGFALDSYAVLVLAVGVLFSTSAALFHDTRGLARYGYNQSLTVDMLVYSAYGILMIIAWGMIKDLPRWRIAHALVWSAYICAAATALQLVLTMAGLDSVLNFLNYDTDARGTNLFGGTAALNRTGPFADGQQLGFVSGALLLVCLRQRKYAAALASLFCVFISQSTTAFLGLLVGLGVVAVLRISPRVLAAVFSLAVLFAVAWSTYSPVRAWVQLQASKLGASSGTPEAGVGDSLEQRLEKTRVATEILWDFPALGVGPGRFGAYYFEYADPSLIPFWYFNQSHRALVENVYFHIGAELGIISFIAFIILIISLFFYAVRRRPLDLAFAVFVAIGAATQPTWHYLPLWVFLAYLSSMRVQALASDSTPRNLAAPTAGRARNRASDALFRSSPTTRSA